MANKADELTEEFFVVCLLRVGHPNGDQGYTAFKQVREEFFLPRLEANELIDIAAPAWWDYYCWYTRVCRKGASASTT